jgi:hypothetical protein
MKKTLNYILVGLVLIALFGVGYLGYTLYPAQHPCPTTSQDTLYIHDTIPHYIPDTIPYYIVKHDTIVYTDTIPAVVDTAAILRNFYAEYTYTRTWTDSLLTATIKDVISQNTPIENIFTYKILRPQTIVTNITNNYFYGKYIIAGLDVPMRDVKYVNIDVMFVTRRWYAGAGYNIYLNSPTIKAGATLFKLK